MKHEIKTKVNKEVLSSLILHFFGYADLLWKIKQLLKISDKTEPYLVTSATVKVSKHLRVKIRPLQH